MISANTKDLLSILKKLNFKSDSNILHIEMVKSNLWLSKVDYNNSLSLRMDCSILDNIDHGITVNFDKVFKLLKKSKAETIILDVSGGKLNILLDSISANILVHETDLFIPKGKEHKFHEIGYFVDSKKLSKQFIKCLKFSGQNESRKNLMGINLKNDYIMGADAFRIQKIVTEETTFLNDKIDSNGVIIPTIASKIISTLDFKKLDIYLSDDEKIRLENNDIVLVSNLVDAVYPDITMPFNRENSSFSLNVKKTLEGLEQIYELLDRDCNSVIKLTFKNDQIIFSSQPEFEETFSFTYEDDGLKDREYEIGLNLNFLIEALKANKEHKSLFVYDKGNTTPFILESKNESHVLMPVIIKW